MLKVSWLGVVLAVGFTVPAWAYDSHDRDKDKEPRIECINLYCEYQKDEKEGHGFEKCQAAATFQKKVTWRGGEIEDRSEHPFNPAFEVECDGERIFTNSAYRFTDEMGTRIQAEAGPFPALLLPRGSLQDRHRYVMSALELGSQTLRGFCYVYPGPR